MAEVVLERADGAPVCERCVVANRPLVRARGLLGRRELPSGEGILLAPASSIHTFFMRFAIDVVFVDREGEVLRIAPELPPWRAAGCRGARYVVELTAGECARRGLSPGDRLLVADALRRAQG